MAITDNLISVWRLGEQTGAPRYDSYGSEHLSNNGNASGVADGPPSIDRSTQMLEVSSQYLSKANDANLAFNGDWTIAFWAKFYTAMPAHYAGLVSKDDASTKREFAITYANDVNRFRVYAFHAGTSTNVSVDADVVPVLYTWYFVVVRWNATTHTISISVNNGNVASATDAGVTISHLTQALEFGRANNSNNYLFTGVMTCACYWQRLITADEITTLYNGAYGLWDPTDPTVLWTTPRSWPLSHLVTHDQLNQYQRNNMNWLKAQTNGLVSAGAICHLGADPSTLPSQWQAADGTNGTLSLRDKFLLAADIDANVGLTGGAATGTPSDHTAHALTQPAHATHSVSTAAHQTQQQASTSGTSVSLGTDAAHTSQALTGAHAHANGALPGGHAHTAMSILPPYTARPHIQKLAGSGSWTTSRTWVNGEVPTAAQFNTEFRDNPGYLLSRILPLNAVLAWNSATPPAGWAICDGLNGALDLRDKFIPGSGNTYAVGAAGGAATVISPAHASHSATQPDDHASHTPTQSGTHPSGGPWLLQATVPTQYAYMTSFTHSGFNVDAHTVHSGMSANAHSAHVVANVLPPYYALYFIQLISTASSTTPRTWITGEIVASANFNTFIRDNQNAIFACLFPLSGIAYWNSTIALLPAGYSQCAGANGTPDTRSKYLVGAGSTYALGATGGQASVTIDPHSDHSVSGPTAHANHVVTEPTAHATLTATEFAGVSGKPVGGTHVTTVSAHGAHAFSADAHSAHAPITLGPPFYELPMMQRVA